MSLTIADRQAEIEGLHAELFPQPTQRPAVTSPTPPGTTLPDTEILDRLFAAQNGADVRRLWDGDTSGYVSHSEADLALCSHLAFWCRGDMARMDALFRQSGLYRETKWNRQDYRERTIGKAVRHGRFYHEGMTQRPVSLRQRAVVRRPTLHLQAVSAGEVKPWP
jgi:hypothetical protein